MEKDIDEVGKIARNVKAKIEAINKEVKLFILYIFGSPKQFLRSIFII